MWEISKLVKADELLKQIWPHEARDFTKWLSENLDLLGQEIGIDLELREVEHRIGKYRLDILAHDINDDRIVAIENQLEPTDHVHLGQLITYTARYDSPGIAIWISKQINDEHKAALEWLNRKTDWYFFGVEIKLFKINDSPPAPYFDIIVKPNEWTPGPTTNPPNARNLLYRDFYQTLLERFKKEYPGITNATKGPAQSWCSIPSGYNGLTFQWVFKGNERFVIELYIDFSSDVNRKEKNEDFFNKLNEHKDDIENAIGKELSWELSPNYLSCRVCLERNNVSIISIPDDLYDYAIRAMKLFRDTLRSQISSMGP